MGRWDSDDEEDSKGKKGGAGGAKGGGLKPAVVEKRKAPVVVGEAASVYAFFQEEDWKKFILLDVRPHRDFAAMHICCAFCASVTKNARGRTLLSDTSDKASNDAAADEKRLKLHKRRGLWSDECWMGRPVVVYGAAAIQEDHPVVQFLQGQEFSLPKSITVLSSGFEVFAKSYPGLTSSFARPRPPHRYPAEIIPGKLYLGDWKHAEDSFGLEQLGITRVITIHQKPEEISFGHRTEHMRIMQDDTDTDAITAYFDRSFEFIDAASGGTLVHCGAGISRSATIVIAYMMWSKKWGFDQALKHVQQCRPSVRPNDGFMRALREFDQSPGAATTASAASGGKVDAFLVVYKGDEILEELRIKPGKSLAGRQPEAFILTEHPSCSRQHACLELHPFSLELTITDLGSAHGTTLDGAQLQPKTPKRLVDGSTLVFGASSRKYKVKMADQLTDPSKDGGGERGGKRPRVTDADD